MVKEKYPPYHPKMKPRHNLEIHPYGNGSDNPPTPIQQQTFSTTCGGKDITLFIKGNSMFLRHDGEIRKDASETVQLLNGFFACDEAYVRLVPNKDRAEFHAGVKRFSHQPHHT